MALLIHNLGAGWGWVVYATIRPLYTRQGEPVLITQEAGWASGPVRTGKENLVRGGFEPRILQPVAGRCTD
jgi:hypothetical protein